MDGFCEMIDDFCIWVEKVLLWVDRDGTPPIPWIGQAGGLGPFSARGDLFSAAGETLDPRMWNSFT